MKRLINMKKFGSSPKKEAKIVEIKKLRPWVKISAYTVIGVSMYSIFRTFIYNPKPYIVEFDINKIYK